MLTTERNSEQDHIKATFSIYAIQKTGNHRSKVKEVQYKNENNVSETKVRRRIERYFTEEGLQISDKIRLALETLVRK